jgi:hypothetical protein
MPYTTRNPRTAEDLLAGIAGNPLGLLVDDIATFEAVGGTIHQAASGFLWAVLPDGRAFPTTCGDFVERYSEDGPYTDRCGALARAEGACEGHAAQRDSWLAMTEAEKLAVEMAEERW